MKRKRRLAAFGKQLPEALELIGRALRAGHSLASGFKLVADEMGAADRAPSSSAATRPRTSACRWKRRSKK